MAEKAFSTDSGKRRPTRSQEYYCPNAIFKVEDELFSIPRTCLTDHSEVFDAMFALDTSGDHIEGESDDHPIVLEGYSSRDFQSLLKVVFPRHLLISIPNLPKTEWVGVLRLSTPWQMHDVRKLAIDELSAMALTPLEKITLARENRVPRWLAEGVRTLVENIGDYHIEEIGAVLGWDTTARVFAASTASNSKPLIDNWGWVSTSRLQCHNCRFALEGQGDDGWPMCIIKKGPSCSKRIFKIVQEPDVPERQFVKVSMIECCEPSCGPGDSYSPLSQRCSSCRKKDGNFKFRETPTSEEGAQAWRTDISELQYSIDELFGKEIKSLEGY
ncbi:hypothetical protein BKA70DRAFT_1280242 [Coprinopsis sp. MPI-PUGE-AT-0042]|nr:hypothetical protein BKA70DRAFT_1280242 [Coprinopsis sp. MPI-PUGE-AT-0042]